MNTILKASITVALGLAATLASAQSTTTSIEERLQRLEAEQSAMKQQLAERDAVIQELKRELAAQGGSDGAGCSYHASCSAGGRGFGRAATDGGWAGAGDWRSGGDAAPHAATGRDLGCL